jgi:hypothetical protein
MYDPVSESVNRPWPTVAQWACWRHCGPMITKDHDLCLFGPGSGSRASDTRRALRCEGR